MSTTQNIDINKDVSIGLDADSDADQYLTFILADEEYGVDILRVQEIKGWDNVTPIPNTPEYIKGVINLRGTIVPIIDLRSKFNIENIEYGPMTLVIVLRVESDDHSRIMGIVVDAVSEVYNVDESQMQPPPDFGSVVNVEYIKGIATVDEKMLIMLDIDHLLTSGELAVTDSVSEQ